MANPIRIKLQALDISPSEMAIEIGVSKQFLYAVLNGQKTNPRIADLIEKHTDGYICRDEILYPEEFQYEIKTTNNAKNHNRNNIILMSRNNESQGKHQ